VRRGGGPWISSRDNCATISTDRYAAYELYPPEMRQICWAHIARDIKGLIQRGGVAESFGQRAKAEADLLFAYWARLRAGEINRDELRSLMVPLQERFALLLEEGQESEVKKVRALARSLTKLWPALWTFLYEEMEPTNNASERALRRPVIWRKTSFGSQSGKGMRLVERLLTVAETAQLQQKDLLNFMTDTITAYRTGEAPPKLLPTG
jgi:transposase